MINNWELKMKNAQNYLTHTLSLEKLDRELQQAQLDTFISMS